MSEDPSRPVDRSRRRFLMSAPVLGLGVAACSSSGEPPPPATASTTSQPAVRYDLTRDSAALEPDEIVRSACQFCNSLCGIEVLKKGGRIIGIRGDDEDPVARGGLCVKADLMPQLVYNPRRITTPLKRKSGRKGDPNSVFEPVSWDVALDGIARKLLQIRDTTGPQGVANKTSGRLPRGTGSIIGRFFDLYGSPNATDVGPVCNDAGGNALAWTFGLGNFTNGYGVDGATGAEDLGASKFFLFIGTNQAETHPVTFEYLLRARQATGAKLVVVDPRRTPTAAYADEHLAIRPHTDMALVYGLLAHIIDRELYDRAFVEQWVVGFDELKQHIATQGFSPEWAEGVTSIPAATIRALAEAFAAATPASIFCNAGVSHQMNAFHTYRALAFLSAITGNIGRPGGGCNFMHNTWPGGLDLPPIVGATPTKDGPLPVGPDWFATSILESKPYALRAIFMEGNPLVDSANSSRVKRAYEQLEFLVYPGLFMEEPAYYADYVLPVPSVLEMDTIYMRRDDRGIRWCNQAVPPVGEARPDIWIWIELAKKMAALDTTHPADYWTGNLRDEWKDYRHLWDDVFATHTPGVGGMTSARMKARHEPLRWPCPTSDHPGVSTLYLDHPSWQAAAEALGHKGKRFLTPSGKVELFTPDMQTKLAPAGHSALPPFYAHPETTGNLPAARNLDQLVSNPVNPGAPTPKVELGVTVARPEGFPLVGMIGRPSVVHFATMTQWTLLGKQLNGIRFVQVHPETALAAGIKNGDAIRVESPRGAISGTALHFDGIRKDTLFVPNLFGPQQFVGQEIGLPLYEPANTLVDDRYFDNLSGQQAYKCFACRIVPA